MTSQLLVLGPNYLHRGGAQRHLEELLRLIRRPGLHLASFFGGPPTDIASWLESCNELGHRSWTSYLRSAARLVAVSNEIRPAATLAFGIQPLIVAYLAKSLFGARWRLGYFEISRPWTACTYTTSNLRSHALRRITRAALRNADLIAVNSLSGWSEIETCFGVDPARMHLLRNICRPPKLSATVRLDSSPLRVAVVSRLVAAKRVKDVLDACYEASHHAPLHLTIVGDGPERASLQKFCESNDKRLCVDFLGWIDSPWQVLENTDTLVMSSVYEGYPNTVVEAMFLGIPVVSSKWGVDAVDLIERDVVCGYNHSDSSELASHIVRLAKDSALRTALSSRGKEEARARFSTSAVRSSYERFISKLQG